MKTLLAVLGAAVVFTGCDHDMLHSPVPPAAPRGVTTLPGDGFVEIFWDRVPDDDVAGYYVYSAASYEGPFDFVGSSPTEYFRDNSTRNGYTYYYAVSAFNYEGMESPLSKEVAYDIPRPEGYGLVLTNYRTFPNRAGYDFSDFRIVPFDDQYTDIYFEVYNGTPYMDVREDTDIQDMGPTQSILDIGVAPSAGWSTTKDAVVYPGHTYVVWTWDDHYAKFRVSTVSGTRLTVDWVYQLQKGQTLMKRPAGERRLEPFVPKAR